MKEFKIVLLTALVATMLAILVMAQDPGGWRSNSAMSGMTSAQVTSAASSVSAANTAVTATVPAPGAGFFNYITRVEVQTTCTTAITGSAALTVTTTNLPGSLAWTLGNACAVGSTNNQVATHLVPPLKSSAAATAITVVCPAIGAAGLCRVNVYYFTGP